MSPEELARRVAQIRQELAEASDGRYPVPRLIAVTKTHSAEEILPLLEAGVTEIGENRVQELLGKLPGLQDRFQIHLIGRLQRNKVRQIIGDVCMIQSVDSEPPKRTVVCYRLCEAERYGQDWYHHGYYLNGIRFRSGLPDGNTPLDIILGTD